MKRQVRHLSRARSGFTLAELVASLAIMTILVTAMGSAVVLASQALPNPDDLSRNLLRGQEVAERIETDLVDATELKKARANEIEMVVADRGYGADGPETLKYKWRMSAGDPLTLSINGNPEFTVCEDVHAFEITYVQEFGVLSGMPHVLMAIGSSPTPGDELKLEKLQSWGFDVQVMSATAPGADLKAAQEATDVLYIAREIGFDFDDLMSGLGPKHSKDAIKGMVSGQGYYAYDEYRLGTGGTTWPSDTEVNISDTTHTITSHLATGNLTISSSSQDVLIPNSPWADGLQVLAWRSGKPHFAVMEAGELRTDGKPAKGRRVMLPWGGWSYDTSALTDDAWTLLRRSIVWAAQPQIITSAVFTIQVGADPAQVVKIQVNLLNTPGAV